MATTMPAVGETAVSIMVTSPKHLCGLAATRWSWPAVKGSTSHPVNFQSSEAVTPKSSTLCLATAASIRFPTESRRKHYSSFALETMATQSASKTINMSSAASIFFVGQPHEVAHHAAPFRDQLDVQIATAEVTLERAQPGDLAIFYSEHFERFRECCQQLKSRNVATTQIPQRRDTLHDRRNSRMAKRLGKQTR